MSNLEGSVKVEFISLVSLMGKLRPTEGKGLVQGLLHGYKVWDHSTISMIRQQEGADGFRAQIESFHQVWGTPPLCPDLGWAQCDAQLIVQIPPIASLVPKSTPEQLGSLWNIRNIVCILSCSAQVIAYDSLPMPYVLVRPHTHTHTHIPLGPIGNSYILPWHGSWRCLPTYGFLFHVVHHLE